MDAADYIDLLGSEGAVKGDLDVEDQATLEQNFEVLHPEISGLDELPGTDYDSHHKLQCS